jgi:Zn-dependent protease
MAPTQHGSFRLFRIAGIDLYLHWSWFVVALYEISSRTAGYSSPLWNALEYLTLFGIVLLHEMGHALACRQVGGEANLIVLWPLGGVAYVSPPPRPGATLWSIAAGPLVNVALLPVLYFLWKVMPSMPAMAAVPPDVVRFFRAIWYINCGLLIFNLLPIYPLDGGQIVRSLLWFVVGRAHSLLVASILGFVGVAGLIAVAVWLQSIWIGIMAGFVFLNCGRGLRQSLALVRAARVPRRAGYACPDCQAAPPLGAYWHCGGCRQPFDAFDTQGVCPHCGAHYEKVGCLDCGSLHPIGEWTAPPSFRPNP